MRIFVYIGQKKGPSPGKAPSPSLGAGTISVHKKNKYANIMNKKFSGAGNRTEHSASEWVRKEFVPILFHVPARPRKRRASQGFFRGEERESEPGEKIKVFLKCGGGLLLF